MWKTNFSLLFLSLTQKILNLFCIPDSFFIELIHSIPIPCERIHAAGIIRRNNQQLSFFLILLCQLYTYVILYHPFT